MYIASTAKKRPFLFVGGLTIVMAAAFLVAFAVIRLVAPTMDPATADLILNGVTYSLLAIATAMLLSRLDWWRPAGFRRPFRWAYLLLFWLPALPLLLTLLVLATGGGRVTVTSPWSIAVFAGISLLVGFVEEGVFRGLMVRALAPRGLWTAALVSSALFGLVHAVNIPLGYNAAGVGLQIVYAASFYGLASAALVIYTGTIWPIVLIHALTDFVAWMQSGSTLATAGVTSSDVVSTAVVSVLGVAYGALLLALSKRNRRLQAEA